MKERYIKFIRMVRELGDTREGRQKVKSYLKRLSRTEVMTMVFMSQRSGVREDSQLIGDFILRLNDPPNGDPIQGNLKMWK